MCLPDCRCCRCGPMICIDIVPANYVGKAIVTIHQKDAPAHTIYHLSSGTGSQTFRELTDALAAAGGTSRAIVLAMAGRAIFWNGELALAARRRDRIWRFAAESFLAVLELEYGV